MPILKDGTFQRRDATQMMADLIAAHRQQFGLKVNVTSTGTPRKFMEAAMLLGLVEVEATMEDIHRQMFFESATDENLDMRLDDVGHRRKAASRSVGNVIVTLNTAITSPPEPSPWLPEGSVVFLDTAGRRYVLTADVELNGTTTLTLPVQAQDLGAAGNIGIGSIVNKVLDPSVSTRWAINVASFTNTTAFAGGANRETDKEWRDRVRSSRASVIHGGADGIELAVELVNGVVDASVTENEDDIAQQQNKVFDSNTTGTASETIGVGQTYTKIAQKVTITSRRFIQHFNAKVTHGGTAPEFRVRLETDASGSPSGVLVDQVFDKRGFAPTNGVVTGGSWPGGNYLTGLPVTAWLVYDAEVGLGTFDGDNAGGTNYVKRWNGSAWSNSTLVKNLNMEIIGGVPPHGFRVFASGGTDDDIAQAIWGAKSTGIKTDGLASGTALDRSGREKTIYFERPTLVAVTVTIVLTKTTEFTADANAVRDLIVEYIGGTDTNGNALKGLSVNQKLIRLEIASRILEDSNLVGVEDITTLTLARKPSAESAQNLTPADGEEFYIETVATDINVTLNDA